MRKFWASHPIIVAIRGCDAMHRDRLQVQYIRRPRLPVNTSSKLAIHVSEGLSSTNTSAAAICPGLDQYISRAIANRERP